MNYPTSLVIPCSLVKNANLHVEGYVTECHISYEPPLTGEETGDIWLNKETLKKLIDTLEIIYEGMDD